MAENRWPPKKTPILAIGRELLSNTLVSQTELCLATGLLSWKVSRLMNRLEIFGFVEVEEELHFARGRPRKLYRLTASGAEYFSNLLEAGDENPIPRLAPR